MPLADLPANAQLDAPAPALADLPQGAQLDASYTGSILPFQRDAQGNLSFAVPGIIRDALSAAKAPGDVYMGRAETPYSAPLPPAAPNSVSAQPDPELLRRAFNLAMMASPANPAVRAGDKAIPGESMASMRPSVAAPTATDLRKAGASGYDAFRDSGVEATGLSVGGMARALQDKLRQEGFVEQTAPKTHAIIGDLTNPPEGGVVTAPYLHSIYKSFGKVTGDNADQAAAGIAKRTFQDYLAGLGPQDTMAGTTPPQAVTDGLRSANANYGAAMRSNNLTGELDRAVTGLTEKAELRAQAANSGRNLDNTIRQKVLSFISDPQNVAGYSDAELNALRQVVEGGGVRNAARRVGNWLGAGGGVGQTSMAALGAGIGGTVGGWPGAAIGFAAPATTGEALRSLANGLAKRSLSKADELVRMNSPLYQEMMSEQPLVRPGLGRDMAILRAIGLGAPNPSQQPSGLYGAAPGLYGGYI